MLTHEQVWSAIDALAERYGLSTSGLAKKAGLDPTTFNKSKRLTADGHRRWPSTESIAKILEATGATLDSFMALLASRGTYKQGRMIPLIGFAQAGQGGFFDDGGFPVGSGWDEVQFPSLADEQAYALEVSGDSMLPLYRDGDVVIASPAEPVRRNDRVIVRTTDGEVMAKILKRETAKSVELASLNPDHPMRTLDRTQIAAMHRIMWARQ
ncbi:helix-turn-helix transcriptional regulator [Terrarubrum flagellatum]|uniref:S24 family peptidase n=1 Tax=Terrirubrum flagellatum TaxID=2895980 RepID=UPI003145331B